MESRNEILKDAKIWINGEDGWLNINSLGLVHDLIGLIEEVGIQSEVLDLAIDWVNEKQGWEQINSLCLVEDLVEIIECYGV
jgi:hypothetical protein